MFLFSFKATDEENDEDEDDSEASRLESDNEGEIVDDKDNDFGLKSLLEDENRQSQVMNHYIFVLFFIYLYLILMAAIYFIM